MMHHSDGNVFNTSLSNNTKLKSAQEKKKTLKEGSTQQKHDIHSLQEA
jgi:hypothetical protein